MIYELESLTRESVVTCSRSHLRIYLERLRKTTEKLSQNSRCPGQSVTATQTCSDTTSALDTAEWSASRSRRFIRGKRGVFRTYCTGH
jgi:hypothetical protein